MPQPSLASTANRTRRDHAAPVVCLDADNTLWDTDGVFAAAQLRLLANVITATGIDMAGEDRLAYVREIDQELASRHHLGLRYPARLLIAALCHRLLGDDPGLAARKTWNDPSTIPLAKEVAEEIEKQYLSDLGVTPRLLPGVHTGLERLHHANAVLVLVTEGGRDRVGKLLQANKITRYIDRVIDAPKRKELFVRLRRLFGSNGPVYMIGDQITRDIKPAAEAGLRTIHIQGKFRPIWETGAAAPTTQEANTFEDAANAILARA
ncbi:HAD family hydrolase [Ensifer sp. LCM 4579]|uniref:HAD family hydrolase n=1 Tax=Ensifer sp. LCM 4579 TaxID=1848292 RepID=UPI0009F2CCDE|nr:HAD family hydrolase [Ensifer sp. LCM 4579]